MFINEGLNDRFEDKIKVEKMITSDIELSKRLDVTPPERIWFGSDWHIYQWKNDKVHLNPKYYDYIRLQNEYVKEDDIFIYLGDLMDDECQNYDEFKTLFKNKLTGYPILIIGNNELQPEKYYNELGFKKVFYALEWSKFTFSHEPLRSFNTSYNIHGHMHQWWDYSYQGLTWNNMIKIYTDEYQNKPINLREIVNRYNKGYYTKNVK